MRSLYRWQGTVHEDVEWQLSIKTTSSAFDACRDAIREIHPYDLPELVASPFTIASDEYRKWAEEQVGPMDANSAEAGSDRMLATDRWHLRIAGLPSDATIVGRGDQPGETAQYLHLPTGPSPLGGTFEELLVRLSRQERLHCEADGSLVWRSPETLADGRPRCNWKGLSTIVKIVSSI